MFMVIYTISIYVSCVNFCDITKYFTSKLIDCVHFHESHCFQVDALKVPTPCRLYCIERRSTHGNNHTRAFPSGNDTQTFGAVKNGALKNTRDSKSGWQNRNVIRVGGMQQVPTLKILLHFLKGSWPNLCRYLGSTFPLVSLFYRACGAI